MCYLNLRLGPEEMLFLMRVFLTKKEQERFPGLWYIFSSSVSLIMISFKEQMDYCVSFSSEPLASKILKTCLQKMQSRGAKTHVMVWLRMVTLFCFYTDS